MARPPAAAPAAAEGGGAAAAVAAAAPAPAAVAADRRGGDIRDGIFAPAARTVGERAARCRAAGMLAEGAKGANGGCAPPTSSCSLSNAGGGEYHVASLPLLRSARPPPDLFPVPASFPLLCSARPLPFPFPPSLSLLLGGGERGDLPTAAAAAVSPLPPCTFLLLFPPPSSSWSSSTSLFVLAIAADAALRFTPSFTPPPFSPPPTLPPPPAPPPPARPAALAPLAIIFNFSITDMCCCLRGGRGKGRGCGPTALCGLRDLRSLPPDLPSPEEEGGGPADAGGEATPCACGGDAVLRDESGIKRCVGSIGSYLEPPPAAAAAAPGNKGCPRFFLVPCKDSRYPSSAS